MSLIYEPSGRAREYAPLACNVYRGCDHGCVYCYAPSSTRKTRESFNSPGERADFLHKLDRECHRTPGIGQRVLLSFTCDPYQRFDVEHALTRDTIIILHRHGYNVQILTKGGSRALRDIDLLTSADAFATTMTLLSDRPSLEWEPGAALPSDRIYALHRFQEAGIPTWVSLEPVLDPDSALQIIRETHSFVDLFKVGKLNYHPLSKTIDWAAFALDVVSLLESLEQAYYIKDDLALYLSAGVLGPHHTTVAALEQHSGPACGFAGRSVQDSMF